MVCYFLYDPIRISFQNSAEYSLKGYTSLLRNRTATFIFLSLLSLLGPFSFLLIKITKKLSMINIKVRTIHPRSANKVITLP